MKSKFIRQVLFPLLAAIIWGTAFVFQSDSTEYIRPFTFNALRSVVGAAFLGLVLLARHLYRARRPEAEKSVRDRKALLWGGLACGTVLTVAANLQQLGLGDTSPGKAAFITALYVVLVPVVSLLLLRKKQGPIIWVSVAVAVVGLYFLCINGAESVAISDMYVLLCAFAFTAHILVIDRFGARVDGIELSFVQFIVVALWSSLGVLVANEQPSIDAILHCVGPILFVGILSSGVAYTLQILAQKDSNSTVVSLILCLESVFATLAAVLMRGEWMTSRETLGSVLMLAAVVLAQIPTSVWKSIGAHVQRRV